MRNLSTQEKIQQKMERLARGKSKMQREMDALMEKLNRERFTIDPQLNELEAKINSVKLLDVKCPNCGESTRGNRMNGVPYCFKCNLKVTPNQKKTPIIRVLSKEESLRRSLASLNPGLNPK